MRNLPPPPFPQYAKRYYQAPSSASVKRMKSRHVVFAVVASVGIVVLQILLFLLYRSVLNDLNELRVRKWADNVPSAGDLEPHRQDRGSQGYPAQKDEISWMEQYRIAISQAHLVWKSQDAKVEDNIATGNSL